MLQQEKEILSKEKTDLVAQKAKLTEDNKKLSEQKAQSERKNQSLSEQLLTVRQTLEAQLLHVQQALEQAHTTNQSLITQLPKKHWGAGTRVQEQLNYRIGHSLIQHSRSVWGWITMPFAPWKAYRQYKLEGLDKKYQELPPLKYYEDFYLVERYQHHLSFRLGQTYLSHIKNPLKWLTMPFALLNDIKDFRNNKNRA